MKKKGKQTKYFFTSYSFSINFNSSKVRVKEAIGYNKHNMEKEYDYSSTGKFGKKNSYR